MKKTMGLNLGACAWMALALTAAAQTTKDYLGVNPSTTAGFTDTANWTPSIPVNNLTSDIARFNQTSYANSTLGHNGYQLYGVQFGDGTTASADVTITIAGAAGQQLRVGAGGVVMNANSGNATINKLAMPQNLTIANHSTSLLSIGTFGIWQNDSNFTATLNGTGRITFTGVISNQPTGSNTGLAALNVDGAEVTLSGANTFTGGLTLNSGTLILGNNAALGGAGNVLTIKGGTINVNAARTTTNNNAQNWDGDFTFAGASTWNTGTGAVTLGGNRIVTVSASTMTVGGAIGGGFSLTKAGAGTLTLSGNNTYSGGTTLSGGTLDITGNANALGIGTLTLGNGTTVNANNSAIVEYDNNIVINGNVSLTGLRTTYNGTVDLGSATRTLTVVNAANNGNVALRLQGVISGNGGITKEGTGGLRLGNTANTFTGDVTVNAGMLEMRSGGSLGNAANKLIINGDGTVRITNQGVQTLTVSHDIEVNANFDLLAGGTITLNGAMNLGGGTRTIKMYGNEAKVINGNISNGGLALAYGGTGLGTLTLGGNNTYAGTTTVGQDCTLQINGTHAGNGAINVQTGGTLQINGTHTGSGLITVASGAKLEGIGTAGNTLIQSGGTLAPGNSVGELTLGDLTLDGGATMAWEFDGVGGVDELNLDGLWKGTGTGWSFDFLGTGPGTMGSFTLIRFAQDQTNFQTGDFTVSNLTLAPEQSGSIVVNGSAGEVLLTVIPEPASLGMLGILVVAGVLRRRLRR